MLQRRFQIGFNRAARIVEEMERQGIVGPSEGGKPREVYVTHRE
jgi:S-DNA-T family DNA segregation ATPase FtsK/SpoIIIE